MVNMMMKTPNVFYYLTKIRIWPPKDCFYLLSGDLLLMKITAIILQII